MDFILSTFAWLFALTLAWPFWVIFSVFTFWTCAEETQKIFGFLATLLIGSIVIRTFGWGWEEYKLYLAIYPVVGIAWSFYRWERFGQFVREETQTAYDTLQEFRESYHGRNHYGKGAAGVDLTEADWKTWRQDTQRSKLVLKKNVDKISYWITSWPVSMLTWGLHDILTIVKRFITVYACKVYDSISERHIEK